MSIYDFANMLFAGPCNAHCPTCIGKQIDPRFSINNLQEYPPRNLERLVELIEAHGIREVVFTGTTTDPQMYHHEARLLALLRACLHPAARFSLHTNGRLVLHKLEVFNLYDRVSLSFPSFNPETYAKMMGVPNPPDLVAIMGRAAIPIKISCLVTTENAGEIEDFLKRCVKIGVQRVVLRKLYGDKQPWEALIPEIKPPEISETSGGLILRRLYRHNPVYDFQGMEVTLWDFDQTGCTSINLFSTGVISTSYLLAEAHPRGEK